MCSREGEIVGLRSAISVAEQGQRLSFRLVVGGWSLSGTGRWRVVLGVLGWWWYSKLAQGRGQPCRTFGWILPEIHDHAAEQAL